MASWRWRGVMRLTLRSLAAFCGTDDWLASGRGEQGKGESEAPANEAAAAKTGGRTYPGKLEHLGGEILQYRRNVDGCLGADTHLVLSVLLQETFDTTAGELLVTRSAGCVTAQQRNPRGGATRRRWGLRAIVGRASARSDS